MKNFIAICSFFVLCLGTLYTLSKEDKNEGGYYNEQISFEQLKKDLKKEKERVVYFYKDDCQYCEKITPTIVPLAKEDDISLSVLNAGKHIEVWDEFNLEGVPTIIHFRDGKEVSRIVGLEEKDVYKNWFLETKKNIHNL
ncbi:thioredoxin family protein [Bacillus cereus]